MDELPFELKKLEPLSGALDTLRFLGEIDALTADADEICDALDMSNIRFGKAIRRLVTQGYVQMDGVSTYRLTEKGREATDTLAEYDEAHPDGDEEDDDEAFVSVLRRLVIAMPEKLAARKPNAVIVGLEGQTGDSDLTVPADMVLRLSVVNGEPATPQEAVVTLENDAVQHVFSVMPDAYQQVRVRVQVFQLGPNPDDINISGGVYVDADVTGDSAQSQQNFVAYGGNIAVQVLE